MDPEEKLRRECLARRGRRADAGFTILETAIALSVAMVIGFGSISLFLFSVNYNAGATDRARAAALAQQRLEELRATAYSALNDRDTTESVVLGSTSAGESDSRTFTVRTQVEPAAGVSNSRQKKITVTVTPAAAGRWSSGSVGIVTYRSSPVIGSLP